MKHILCLLLTAILCATASAQTIKTLGFNTTNGQVVANTGTNVLTFGMIAANGVTLPNGSLVDQAQFTAPQFSGALLSFEESRLFQYGGNVIEWDTNRAVLFGNAAATRTNLGLPLAALTNTSNVTMMRALAGSTNTNHPFSGSISVTGTNNTNTLVFSNGILQSVQ